jgi:pilus assembly protein Flp/PilA
MHRQFKNLKKKEKGQGLVEYALILVLVAIVVIAALMILGPIIGNVFSTINSSLGTVSTGGGAAAVVVPAPTEAPTQAPNLGTCYLRWTGKQWVHWYDNTPEYPGPCP